MPDQSHKQTPYDQFNFEIPKKFPEQGMSAAAANGIVNSETWTDANPMLNLSSFVTTYCEPEAKNIYDLHMVALTLDESVKRYNEFDISNKVRERGWVLSAYSMPPDAQEINSLRIVVRPHLNQDVTEILARDIELACEYLEQHGGSATPPKLHDAHKTSVKC
jgi:glutamate/tyrosine decarboxylase-like PLP-dependent enzyme